MLVEPVRAQFQPNALLYQNAWSFVGVGALCRHSFVYVFRTIMNLVNGFIASMLFIRPTMKRCMALLHLCLLGMLKGIGNMPFYARVVQLC